MTEYRRNHYVPEWYQRRFLADGETQYHYLDLRPDIITANGHTHTRKACRYLGPKRCFAQDDLYTTNWGGAENRDIEKFFFRPIDTDGQKAVDHFANFEISDDTDDAWNALVPYMSVQKLRTPKGLAWFRQIIKSRNKNKMLIELQNYRNIFCNMFAEAVWQIADASQSPTKFIISDHPVVAYNRECFPGSKWCIGANDPDVRYAATHTYFPLSLEKILILTNLTWVRDPYQDPRKLRPNPRFFRSGKLFNILEIQRDRLLTEEEVLEINYITKKRAFRYVAAAKEEWLHPERRLRSTNWRKLGDGYLLMPDPRHIHGGGNVVVGFENGSSTAWSEYGHKPWEEGYEDTEREEHEWAMMQKFKAEWAAQIGPNYRGLVYDVMSFENGPRRSMGAEWHQQECERDREYLKRSGERARRRRLRR